METERILKKVKAKSVFLSAVALAATSHTTEEKKPDINIAGVFAVQPVDPISVKTPEESRPGGEITISLPVQITRWTNSLERRFNELCRLSALEQITREQQRELTTITDARRRFVHPRTSEEILFEIKRDEVTTGLIAAVQAYANFQQRQNQKG